MKNGHLVNTGKTNPIQTQFKPNQSQNKPNSNPISKHLQSPICTGHLLINRMNQICCVCSFSVSFDSAKMALYKNNLEFEKGRQKNLNLLKHKRLNSPALLRPLTGTLFAHSLMRNIVLRKTTAKGAESWLK